jgi:hypothetical protein
MKYSHKLLIIPLFLASAYLISNCKDDAVAKDKDIDTIIPYSFPVDSVDTSYFFREPRMLVEQYSVREHFLR